MIDSSADGSDPLSSPLTFIQKMILVIGLLGTGLVLIFALALSARKGRRAEGSSAGDSGPADGWLLNGAGSDHVSGSEGSPGDSGGGDGGGGDGGGGD